MKEPLEIISDIRNFILTTNPFRFPYLEASVLDLLNELENTLTPQSIEEPVVEEPVVEESIIEVSIDVVEQPIVESLTIETTVEEPIVEVVTPKKTTRKK